MKFLLKMKMLAVVMIPLFFYHVHAKECTNTPSELSSHTYRHQLLSSYNNTDKEQMLLSHNHLTPSDDSTWASLIPRKVLKEEDEHGWMMMYRHLKNQGAKPQVSGTFLNEVALGDVRLDPDSIHGQAQQTNLEYLLMFDVDRLVWNFRKTAGLLTPGVAYGGWEAPDQELRGHFVGHYLSATALMWASTGHEALKEKMTQLVSALGDCQEKMKTGYLSAFPTEFFDRVEASKTVWAPYYTIHKIMAGLLDQYAFAGNDQALQMVIKMADYFCKRVQNVITRFTIERHWQSLNEEYGGMNDVMYRLYTITGDTKHLLLANLFDKPCFLGPLAIKVDELSGFHSNTHIPIVVGSQMRYEVTGESIYKEIGMFFMDAVNSSHTYATGGTSVGEFWTDPKRLATTLEVENEESCVTYNMLKVSRILFRWTKEMAYADYYERALTNGVLSIQRGKEPGIMIYMLPLGPGMSKAFGFHKWGTPFDTFWCCYGTGIESFSKLGDSIYFEEAGKDPGLYIIQYISSSVNWKLGQIFLEHKVTPVVSWDPRLRVTTKVSSKKEGLSSSLKFRIPFWTTLDAKATLNGQGIPLVSAGKFLSVTKKWGASDVITLELPITLRMEAIQDDRSEFASLNAILYGPHLLVGLTTGESNLKPASGSLYEWITPIPSDYNSQLISLSQENRNSTFALAHTNKTITMLNYPGPGTIESVFSTFRIISADSKTRVSSYKDAIGKTIMLEPYDLPGMLLVHQGKEQALGISGYSEKQNALFHLLGANEGVVRLESVSQKGCFVHSLDGTVTLRCESGEPDAVFVAATSFKANDGISSYHPISFVANGLNIKYLLQPLFSLRDEQYTVYFKILS
ncbi:putative six-hairpin glycosidase superfamily, beta-L-arabinofuranosidase, GH127 [Helianthus annuus]|nr:putative six-hairpin glycosidase superfamily, beta-L-arabinofuranosidase, GH127 [Helianthus annuus]